MPSLLNHTSFSTTVYDGPPSPCSSTPASSTSSTESDPLYRPLPREAASDDDIEALRSVYTQPSSDSDTSSVTGWERVGVNISGFYKYIKISILTIFAKMGFTDLESSSKHQRYRHRARRWLESKYQHYTLITLIAIDVSLIFADIFISLYTCEEGKHRSESTDRRLDRTQEGLKIISLIFSCIFLLELLITLWAFGLAHLKSKFHIFDATVIIAGFVLDVVLNGVNSEVASLVVLLRLFRFVKIVEEMGSTQETRVEELKDGMERLRRENEELGRELGRYRTGDLESRGGGR